MFRVITIHSCHSGTLIIEYGPWHTKKEVAEHWFNVLKSLGYKVKLEEMKKDAME